MTNTPTPLALQTLPVTRQIGIRQRSLGPRCRMGRATELVFVLVTGVTLVLSGAAQAQTWDGDTDTNYLTGTNWAGDVAPAPGGAVVIDGAGGANQPALDFVDTSTVDTVAVSAGTLTVDGDLTATSGTTVSNIGTVLVFGNLTGDTGILTGGTVTNFGTITGNVNNAGSFTNDVAFGTVTGSVTNSGTGFNGGDISSLNNTGGTFDNISRILGDLTVSGGTVTNRDFGTVDGTTAVSGGTVILGVNSDLADASAVTVSVSGTLTVNAADTVGSLGQSGGTIDGTDTLTTGTFTQSGGATDGTVTIGTTDFTQSGGATLGFGTTVTSAGINTLSGGTIAGTLNGGGTTTIDTATTTVSGTIDGDVTVGSGGTLGVTGTTNITGTITTTGSVIDYADGTNLATAITIASDTTQLQVTTGAAEQSGDIGEDAAGRPLEKIGAGQLTLSGTNSYTGLTTVTGGTLVVDSNVADVQNNATFINNGTAEAVTNAGTGSNALGGVMLSLSNTGTGTFTNSGAITTTLDINGGVVTLQTGATVGGATTVADGARLDLDGGIPPGLTVTGAVSLAGTGGGLGALRNVNGLNDVNGLVTLATDVRINSDAGQLTLLGGIAGTDTDLTVGGAGTVLVASDITTGTGTLTKDGAGVLGLSGANDFTGNVQVTAGNLQLSGGAALADSVLVTVDSLATLQVGSSETVGNIAGAGDIILGQLADTTLTVGDATPTSTFSGVISEDVNTGSLTKQGTGTLTLSGANTYTGITTISAGTLQVGAGGTEGTLGTGAVTNNAALTFDRSDAITVANAISGTGTVTQAGAGTTTLTGANSYSGTTTISAGTLQVGAGGTEGTLGTGAVTNNAALTFDRSDAVTVANAISGSGSVTQTGTGTTTLTGANTYTGLTTVSAGTLVVDSISSVAAVQNNATFTNNGTAGAVSNAATGTNAGTLASLTNTAGTFGNTATISGTMAVSGGTVTNTAPGSVGGATTITAGTVTNTGTLAAVDNAGTGTFTNSGTAGAVTNAATGTNASTVASLTNTAGTFGNTATITGTMAVSGGAVTNAVGGTVGGATTITGGSVANAGTLAAVDNSGTGTFTNQAGGTAAAVTNAGTGSNAGGIASLNNSGSFATTGTVFGGVTNSSALSAAGVIEGDVTNSGSVLVTGDLTALGANFDNIGSGTLAVTGGDFTGLATLENMSSAMFGVTVDAGRTLGVSTLTNFAGASILNNGTVAVAASTLINDAGSTFVNNGVVTGTVVNSGTLISNTGSSFSGGAFTNTASGVFEANGAVSVGGAASNAGTVDLANGSTADRLTFGSTLAAGGTFLLDANLTEGAQGADVITVAGATSGTPAFAFTILNPATSEVGENILFFDAQGGGTFTLDPSQVSGLSSTGAVITSVKQTGTGGDLFLVTQANPAIGGLAANVSLTQSLLTTVVNRPTSPLVDLGRVEGDACRSGGFARISGGEATVTGKSNNGEGAQEATLDSSFGSIQAGFDSGCYDGRFNDWDLAFGGLVGLTSGSTSQGIFLANAANAGLLTNTVVGNLDTDFEQTSVGLYMAARRDRFLADVQLRYDDTDFDFTENTVAGATPIGLNGASTSSQATTLAARINYVYTLETPGLSFIPNAGFSYTSTDGDTVNFTNGSGQSLVLNSYDTLIGFAGGTLARTVASDSGKEATTTFLTLNYYQDFGDDPTSVFYDGLGGSDAITTSNIGGYGEIGIGLNYFADVAGRMGNVQRLNAAVRADLRSGDNVSDAYALTAQIRFSF